MKSLNSKERNNRKHKSPFSFIEGMSLHIFFFVFCVLGIEKSYKIFFNKVLNFANLKIFNIIYIYFKFLKQNFKFKIFKGIHLHKVNSIKFLFRILFWEKFIFHLKILNLYKCFVILINGGGGVYYFVFHNSFFKKKMLICGFPE